MPEDGVIKFNAHCISKTPPETIYIEKLERWRARLHRLGLIGVYPDGVGYGNLSRRFQSNSFIISGSATGAKPGLVTQDYVLVKSLNIQTNSLQYAGDLSPSSESLTHGIIYHTNAEVRYVLHVHHHGLWQKFRNILPTTAGHIPYGTPEMAWEVKRLMLSLSSLKPQVLIMGGHAAGLIVYGRKLDDVGQRLLNLYASREAITLR